MRGLKSVLLATAAAVLALLVFSSPAAAADPSNEGKTLAVMPTVNENLVYNGDIQSVFSDSGENVAWSGTVSAVKPGEYTVYVVPQVNCVWEEGNDEGRMIVWRIEKAPLTIIPEDVERAYGDAEAILTARTEGLAGTDRLVKGVDYFLDREEGNKVGTYEISAVLSGGGSVSECYDVTCRTGTYTIGKKRVVIQANDAAANRGGAIPDFTASVTGLLGADTLEAGVDYLLSCGVSDTSETGTYPILPELLTSPECYDVECAAGSFTVAEASRAVEPSAVEGLVYNGTLQTGVAGGTGWKPADPDTCEGNTASAVNAGTYVFYYQPIDGFSWEDGSVDTRTVTWRIDRAPVWIIPDDVERVYGDDEAVLTAKVEGLAGNDALVKDVDYTLSRRAGNGVGTYEISVRLNDGGRLAGLSACYDVSCRTGTYTIGKKRLTIRANDAAVNYGDVASDFTASVLGLVGTDSLVPGVDFRLRCDAGETPERGTYPILPELLLPQECYDAECVSGTFSVTNAGVATEPSALKGLVYDGTLQTGVTGGAHWKPADTGGENPAGAVDAGTYTFYYQPNEGYVWEDNSESVRSVVWSIAPKPAVLVPDEKSKVYGEADPELTYSVQAMCEGDTLQGATAIEREAGNDAGVYTITVTPDSDANPNYDFGGAPFEGRFTVLPREAAILADNKEKTWDGTGSAFTATITGLIDGESFVEGKDYELLCCGDALNYAPGSYEIMPVPAANAGADAASRNYRVAYVNGTLTVDPVGEAAAPAVSEGLVYDGTEQGLTGGDRFVLVGGKMGAVNAGTYTAVLRPEDGYAWADHSNLRKILRWTISPRPLGEDNVAEIPAQDWTGSAIEPEITVKVGETVLVEGTDYSVSCQDHTEAGVATVCVDGKGNYTGSVSVNFVILEPDPILYSITEGADGTWTKGSESPYTLRGSGEFEDFTGLMIDDVSVSETEYAKSAGSTIVSVGAEYLQRLSAGSHSLTMLWKLGRADTTFTVLNAVKTDEEPAGDDGTDEKSSVAEDTGDGNVPASGEGPDASDPSGEAAPEQPSPAPEQPSPAPVQPSPAPDTGSGKTSPATGDERGAALLIVMTLCSAGGVVTLLVSRGKKRSGRSG